jgi:uncharacterized membrane protein
MISLAVSPVLGIVISLHVLAAVVWVGGLFFAYVMLRPAAAGLGQPVRLGLWVAVLHRFFRWVWVAAIILFLTGQLQIVTVFGSYRFAPMYVHLMHGLGLLMIGVFLYVWFGPWKRLKRSVGEQQWDEGIVHLGHIRRAVILNLTLGLATLVVATGGRFF